MSGNRIYFGDCLDVMRRLETGAIDMVFTDMPYGTTKNKWDSVIDLQLWWEQIRRICKSNAAILLTCQMPFTATLALSNEKWLRYDWVYQKTLPTGYLNAKKMPMRSHETVLVFYKKPPVYNPQKTHGHKRKVSTRSLQTNNYGHHNGFSYNSTERYPLSVQVFKSDRQKSAIHSTQKPVCMAEYFIKTYTNEGALVLDTCAGSGTTGIACKNTGRQVIMIENDLQEYQKCVQRCTENDLSLEFEKL